MVPSWRVSYSYKTLAFSWCKKHHTQFILIAIKCQNWIFTNTQNFYFLYSGELKTEDPEARRQRILRGLSFCFTDDTCYLRSQMVERRVLWEISFKGIHPILWGGVVTWPSCLSETSFPKSTTLRVKIWTNDFEGKIQIFRPLQGKINFRWQCYRERK